MAEIIQLRRDRSNSWATINPILAQGEMGYELDTNKFKIGDGVTPWVGLEYFASDSIQVSEIPVPSEDEEGRIIEYIGPSLLSYKNGYFYKCLSSENREAEWEAIVRQDDLQIDSIDVDTMIGYILGRYDDLTEEQVWAMMLDYGATLNYYSNDGSWWELGINDDRILLGQEDVTRFGIEISGNPVNGDEALLTFHNAGYSYKWKRINTQPATFVEDNLTSTSMVDALSANQGRILKDLIDNVQSIGRFLAIWDCDTGTARYLDVGFQYEQGDYFIVGTKGAEDDTRSGSWSSEEITSTDNLEVLLDDITLFENKCGKVNRSVTFTVLASNSIKCSYDNVTYTKMGVYNTFGIEISSKSEASYTPGDQVIITYIAPVTSYVPVGSEYDPVTGHEASTDDIEVSDMFFYDGEHWIYLANHERQIAVDEDLNAASRNPVENRVITQALSEKVNESSLSNIIYATDDDGEQTVLSVGEGLTIDNGQIKNTRTSAEWGNIEGNIEDQADLVEYIDSHSGSSTSVGVPQIANVTIKQINSLSQEYSRVDAEYKGSYANILFNLNLSKDQILEKMDDLYVGISRFKRNKNANVEISEDDDESIRYLSKFSLMNDKYVKIDHKAYCWRVDTDNGMAYSNPQRYRYFYTFNNYSDDINLLHDADPSIYTFYGQYTESNYAKCLNALRDSGLVVGDVWDPDYLQRYEEGDIDVFVNVMKNEIGNPSYTYAHLMRCRKYKNGGQIYYLWSYGNWENSTNDVYAMPDYSIPEFYGDLVLVGTIEDFQDYTFVERRDDLNYYRLEESYGDLEKFTYMAQNYILRGHSFGDTHVNWLAYWMDYPVMPVLLRDCDVIAQKYVHNEELDIGVNSGDIVPLKYIVKNNLTDCLIEGQPVQFMLPYDTYYLWLRFSAWQKRCLYNEYREDTDEYLPMSYKNSITSAWDWDNGSSMLNRRAFGRQRNGYSTGNHTKVCEYIHFNLYTPANVTMGTVSSSTPIQKRLYINCSNGGSGLRD